MTAFTYTITLRGTDNEKSSITYDLGDFTGADAGADFLAALGAANQIRGALVDITDANVAEEAVRHVISSDNQLPAAADVYEEALLTVHLADPAEAEKVALLRVPAPSIGVFVAATGADRDVVDPTDNLLQQYVQQVSQHAFVSDGEQINVTHPNMGIKKGYRNLRKRKLGR